MTKFKVVLSVSYTMNADNEPDAIFKATCDLVDEIKERGVSVTAIQQLFGSNVEEIEEGGEK